MRLDKKYLNKCYHDAMIMQYQNQLQEKGYMVSIKETIVDFTFDLYAEKNDEKIVYEFKVIGSKQDDGVRNFKSVAKSINAQAIIVYIAPLDEKNIEFDGLKDIILSEFEDIPDELDILSTHTSIEDILIDELTSVVFGDSIKISGGAMISVKLQYGSNGDMSRDDGVVFIDEYPMQFQIELDHEMNVLHFERDIDTSSWDNPHGNSDLALHNR